MLPRAQDGYGALTDEAHALPLLDLPRAVCEHLLVLERHHNLRSRASSRRGPGSARVARNPPPNSGMHVRLHEPHVLQPNARRDARRARLGLGVCRVRSHLDAGLGRGRVGPIYPGRAGALRSGRRLSRLHLRGRQQGAAWGQRPSQARQQVPPTLLRPCPRTWAARHRVLQRREDVDGPSAQSWALGIWRARLPPGCCAPATPRRVRGSAARRPRPASCRALRPGRPPSTRGPPRPCIAAAPV